MFEQYVKVENEFLHDVQALRQGSLETMLGIGMINTRRPHVSRQDLDQSHAALSIDLLQSVLAAEVICVLRYTLLSVSEDGLKNDWLATEFQAQANDERRHMVMVSKRIEALGGVPDFTPAGLTSRIAALGRCNGSFAVRLQQNLAAEQCIVDHYRELIVFFEGHDPQTAAVLRDILQDEEEHTNDMQDLLISCLG